MIRNKSPYFASICAAVFLLSGCSVKMAANIEQSHQGSTLSFGRDRAFVISQIGQPLKTETRKNRIVDTYELQRNSKGWGYFRSGLYGFLDFFSIGLWEIIGTPLESFIQTNEQVTIEYDENNQIFKVHYLQI